MPGFAVSPPRDPEPAPDDHPAGPEPARAPRGSAARVSPITFVPAVAVAVLLAEVSGVIGWVAGLLLVGLPSLDASRPTRR